MTEHLFGPSATPSCHRRWAASFTQPKVGRAMLTGYFEARTNLPSRQDEYRARPVPPTDPFDNETIYLIDTDGDVRETIAKLLTIPGRKVFGFASVAAYLGHKKEDEISCLILDMQFQNVEWASQEQRLSTQTRPPTIYISSETDIPSTVRAMKAGAIDFLVKPIDPAALIEAVQAALVQDRKLRRQLAELSRLKQCFSLLTAREREVLPLVVGGALNKQAAAILGISEVTLQIHRSQVMRKMKANSVADLVRMAIKLRIPHWHGYPQLGHPCDELTAGLSAHNVNAKTRDPLASGQLGGQG